MTKFIKLLSITCALAVSTAVASAHCGKCEKKDHPATAPAAPATAPAVDPAKKAEPAKQEEAPAAPAKKDGDKCPCPSEKPKAVIDLTTDDCPKKCDKDKKDAPAAPATAEEAPAAPAKKDGEKCPCPSEKPKAVIDLTSDDCPKKCDKDKKDAPAAPATAEEAPVAPAKKDGDKKCPNCPDEKPKA